MILYERTYTLMLTFFINLKNIKADRFLYLILLVLLFPIYMFSQNGNRAIGQPIIKEYIQPKKNPFYLQYKITSLGIGYGLNSSDISALFQDKDGFIWVGNKPGVSRFDGYKFQNFTKTENDYLGQVHTIEEDGEGTLWVGGVNGLFFFKNGQFHRVPFKKTNIRSLHLAENNELWVGGFGFVPFKLTQEDLIKIKNKGDVKVNPIAGEKEWEEKIGMLKTWVLDTDKDGVLWLGLEHGHASYDGNGLKVNWLNFSDNYEFSAIAAIHKDSIYWGSEAKGVVFQKNEELKDITNSLCYIIQKKDTSIYFLTTINILELKNGAWKSLHTLDKYGHIYIKEMIADKEGNFWIGAEGELLKLTPSRFRSWSVSDNGHLESNHSIAELPSGKIMIGSSKERLLQFENNDFIRTKDLVAPSNSLTKDLHIDHNGWIWYATSMAGIVLERNGKYEIYNEAEGLGDKGQYFFYKNKKGQLWSGGERGITKINIGENGKLDFENYMAYLKGDEPLVFRSIFESPNGAVWAVGDKGLYEVKNKELIQWAFPSPLTPYPIITNSVIDEKGYLWLSTQGEGLWQCQFNSQDEPELFRQWTKNNGLLSEVVLNIHLDKKNRIWAVGQNGICCLDFTTGKSIVKCFDQTDGWSNEPTSDCHLLESSDSLLWAVGSTGITVFPLYDLPENRIKPYVFITQVQLFDGKEDVYEYADNADVGGQLPQGLVLPHNKNFIRFHFTTTSHSIPEKNRFRYQLEGLDHDWNKVGTERNILYPGLQPGDYTFKVLAANNDGVFGDEPAVFNFKILNPWYRTWWAYTLAAFILFGISFYWYRFQLDKKLARQEADRLKELDELKTRFYSNITHEFRTPLTVISGMADELENNPKIEPRKKINLIKKNSEGLLSLVNQMLDLSKLKAGKTENKLQQSDIIIYLKYLVEAHESFANIKNVGLQFYTEEKELFMDFDAKKMEQVLNNLISNAVKFTPEYGKILVVAKQYISEGNPFLEIKIKDTGIGISKEQLPYIFDRFHQANPIHENQGSGIGLALVKELMGIMDGKIRAESEQEKGTVFFLHFPIKNNAPIISINNDFNFKTPIVLKNENTEQPNFINDELPVLLIIEDNADVVYYLKTCLNGSYQIFNSRNGKLGIEKAQEILPDIIISDVMMPEMDGFEVCKLLKEDERTDHIPIILLTAKATSKDKLMGLEYGADAYLTKPFEKEELLVRLEKLREVRKKLQLKYSSGLISQKTERNTPKTNEENFIEKLESIILKNIEKEDFSIHELSRALLLSRSQVHRKIKALTGMSTAVYIRHVRLQKAKELLTFTEMTVTEIAYEVGFKTPGYFSQVFKEVFGVSASEMREGGQ